MTEANKKILGIFFSSILSGYVPKYKTDVSFLPKYSKELGWSTTSGEKASVAIVDEHEIMNGMTETEKNMFRLGVLIHETMHLIFTNFNYSNKMARKYEGAKEKIYRLVSNLIEDGCIDHYVGAQFGGNAIASHKFTILAAWKNEKIGTETNALSQLINAMIAYGDLGIIKGKFTFEKARDVFIEIVPLYDKGMYEKNSVQRIKIAAQIADIIIERFADEIKSEKDFEKEIKKDFSKESRSGSGKEMPVSHKKDDKKDAREKTVLAIVKEKKRADKLKDTASEDETEEESVVKSAGKHGDKSDDKTGDAGDDENEDTIEDAESDDGDTKSEDEAKEKATCKKSISKKTSKKETKEKDASSDGSEDEKSDEDTDSKKKSGSKKSDKANHSESKDKKEKDDLSSETEDTDKKSESGSSKKDKDISNPEEGDSEIVPFDEDSATGGSDDVNLDEKGEKGEFGGETEVVDGGVIDSDDSLTEEEIEELSKYIESGIKSAKADEEKKHEDEIPELTYDAYEYIDDPYAKRVLNLKPSTPDDRSYELIKRSIEPYISKLSGFIEREFKNQRGGTVMSNTGKLNIKRWYDPGFKSPYVFDKKRNKVDTSMAIMLLVDESGSMTMQRINAAKASALLIAETMAKLNIPCSVIGFSADTPRYGDIELTHYCTWKNTLEERKTICKIKSKWQNRDGGTIRYCSSILKKRPEKNKILFIISDGSPCALSYQGEAAVIDAKEAIRSASRFVSVYGLSLYSPDLKILHEMYGDNFINVGWGDDIIPMIERAFRKIALKCLY